MVETKGTVGVAAVVTVTVTPGTEMLKVDVDVTVTVSMMAGHNRLARPSSPTNEADVVEAMKSDDAMIVGVHMAFDRGRRSGSRKEMINKMIRFLVGSGYVVFIQSLRSRPNL